VEKDLQLSDRVGPAALAEFVTFLTTLPGLNAVCDQLVFSWPGPDVIDRAGIGRVAREGNLVMSGCLASRAEVGAHSGAVSIRDEVPVAVAVRKREVLVLADRGDIEGRFPEFADGVPGFRRCSWCRWCRIRHRTVCVPFRAGSRCVIRRRPWRC